MGVESSEPRRAQEPREEKIDQSRRRFLSDGVKVGIGAVLTALGMQANAELNKRIQFAVEEEIKKRFGPRPPGSFDRGGYDFGGYEGIPDQPLPNGGSNTKREDWINPDGTRNS